MPSRSDVALGPRDVVDRWLASVSPGTARGYRVDVAMFVELVDGVDDVRRVTPEDLDAFEDELGARGASEATVRRRLAGVKSLLAYARRAGLSMDGGGDRRPLPPHPDRRGERILTEDEVRRIFQFAPSKRDRLLLQVAYYAGASAGELAALRWRWVDQAPMHRGEARGELYLGQKPPLRSVLIPGWLYGRLTVYRRSSGPEDPVFGTLERNVARIVARAGELARVPGRVSVTSLVAAHQAHALRRGAPASVVRDTVGASIDAVLRRAPATSTTSSGLFLRALV